MRLALLALAFVAAGGAYALGDAGQEGPSWFCWTCSLLLLVCVLSYRKR